MPQSPEDRKKVITRLRKIRGQAESLERVADLLRGLVEASRMTVQRQRIPLTISIGATLVAPGDDADTILARADLLLYEAKQSGRNAVQVG